MELGPPTSPSKASAVSKIWPRLLCLRVFKIFLSILSYFWQSTPDANMCIILCLESLLCPDSALIVCAWWASIILPCDFCGKTFLFEDQSEQHKCEHGWWIILTIAQCLGVTIQYSQICTDMSSNFRLFQTIWFACPTQYTLIYCAVVSGIFGGLAR